MISPSRPLLGPLLRGIVHCLSVSALAAAASAQAARPFNTDDARVVDPGGYQLETFIKQQRAFHEREFWFLPAHNPFERVELTLGGMWINSTPDGNARALIAQAKTLLKALETNGSGYALTVGAVRFSPPGPDSAETNPFVNGIGSFSVADDAVVIHTNLGARRDGHASMTRGTWGVGAEIRVTPRVFAIAETYGERGEKPTRHAGLRIWVVPNHVQIDTTVGYERTDPERRFFTVGTRLLW
jgi:hypothetical protein